jgi:hypothetical protein
MIKAQSEREVEIRGEIEELNKRIVCGFPADLDSRRQALSRELCSLIAARLITRA